MHALRYERDGDQPMASSSPEAPLQSSPSPIRTRPPPIPASSRCVWELPAYAAARCRCSVSSVPTASVHAIELGHVFLQRITARTASSWRRSRAVLSQHGSVRAAAERRTWTADLVNHNIERQTTISVGLCPPCRKGVRHPWNLWDIIHPWLGDADERWNRRQRSEERRREACAPEFCALGTLLVPLLPQTMHVAQRRRRCSLDADAGKDLDTACRDARPDVWMTCRIVGREGRIASSATRSDRASACSEECQTIETVNHDLEQT